MKCGKALQLRRNPPPPLQKLTAVALRWHQPGERFSSAARFIGDMTLAQSLWAVLCARGLAVEVPVAGGPIVQQTVAADQSGVVGGLTTKNTPVFRR